MPEDEVLYHRVHRDARTGETSISETECRTVGEAPEARPLPPPPPTVAEMTEMTRTDIDPPTAGVSPAPEGITGMVTRLWYEGPREASSSSSIRGYTVTATMHPTRYCWDPGDPRGRRLCSDRPGTEDNWAVEWVYEVKGTYELTAEAVWNGTWTYAGHGASASGELATVRTTATRAYRVDEIRSQLTPTARSSG